NRAPCAGAGHLQLPPAVRPLAHSRADPLHQSGLPVFSAAPLDRRLGRGVLRGSARQDQSMSLQELLAELRSESPEQMEERTAGAFDRIAGPYSDKVLIFGTGYLGKLALSGLRNAGVEPVAFCDNNSRLWDSEIAGIPV